MLEFRSPFLVPIATIMPPVGLDVNVYDRAGGTTALLSDPSRRGKHVPPPPCEYVCQHSTPSLNEIPSHADRQGVPCLVLDVVGHSLLETDGARERLDEGKGKRMARQGGRGCGVAGRRRGADQSARARGKEGLEQYRPRMVGGRRVRRTRGQELCHRRHSREHPLRPARPRRVARTPGRG